MYLHSDTLSWYRTNLSLVLFFNVSWHVFISYCCFSVLARTKNPTKRVGIVQSGYHNRPKFSTWYSWKIAHIGSNNSNHSLTHSQKGVCVFTPSTKNTLFIYVYIKVHLHSFCLPCIPRFSLDYECVLLSYKYKYFNINCYSEWVSEWLLLFAPIWAIFQLYNQDSDNTNT
jgi:hypothetical protein